MNLQFYIRFHTRYGQTLWISGNIPELGNNDPAAAVPLSYLNSDYWTGTIEIKKKDLPLCYKYFLKNQDGEIVYEWGNDRCIDAAKDAEQIQLNDTWNHAGEFENTFYSDAFNKVLLASHRAKNKADHQKNYTHIFKVKAPLVHKHQQVCLLGSGNELHNWDEQHPVMMGREGDWWVVRLDLEHSIFPVAYKYGVYDTREQRFTQFEDGNNRVIFHHPVHKQLTILHDGFIHLANNTWKGAGVAIPVFSLRSRESFGVGEFTDIRPLVDWSKKVGLKLIQLLPVNDTVANFNWKDSYPYSAVSAFALHPLYINVGRVIEETGAKKIAGLKTIQKKLNELPVVDYEEVIRHKMEALRKIFDPAYLDNDEYRAFYEGNKHWLDAYGVFSYLRDKYGSSNYTEWPTHSVYKQTDTDRLLNNNAAARKEIDFYFFVQYHLHLQLKDAVDYAHKKGVVIKGDIPIGISRYSCDAWVAPDMYNMCWQAGAPPDDFTAVGQNWGFPTYNWKKMQEDGFAWWKQRFEQMSNYFDAFRIDHILGFFRIWSIPVNAVQGIMGRFVPCLPVHINEFGEHGIGFDYHRFCKPFIIDEIIDQLFGEHAQRVREEFLEKNAFGGYDLAHGYESQQQVDEHFNSMNEDGDETADENERIRQGLFDLISNVILFEHTDSEGQEFHFRISMEKTSSFHYLPPYEQEKLRALYVDYFYRRQDDFWYHEAMHKLPNLKAATNMLICGEDLGMVPHCVPDVMKQLGILSLEIQRMPKDPAKEFFHPNDAPYLSVITPSTHDMSTVRAWWEENREKTQHFYNHVLSQWGDAPFYCEPWINRAIVLQHLYSPAMWSIFQLQDILGMSETLRRENPHEERINNPANPKHYWQYRMHIYLEDLAKEKDFNKELSDYIEHSGR